MNREESLFERFFGSKGNDGEPIFNASEKYLARIVYAVACDEMRDSNIVDDSNFLSGVDTRIKRAVKEFGRIAEFFKISTEAKNTFLKNFERWSTFRKSNIKCLKKIAEEIQTDKFNSDIAKVVGGVVGAVGSIAVGVSFFTPLAIVTLPLAVGGGVASALGGGVVVGTTCTEIALLKNNLEKAKTLVMQEQASLSTMTPWFNHTQKLRETIDSLIGYPLLIEMSRDLKDFHDVMATDLKGGCYCGRFKTALKLCIGKMFQSSKIIESYGVVAPAVMTFVIVVCLLRYHNRIVLDCAMQVDRLVLGMMSMTNIGVSAGRLSVGLGTRAAAAAGRAVPVVIAATVFVAASLAIDVVNVVLSSIDIHKRSVPEHAKEIIQASEKLEKEYRCLESVYYEFQI